MTTLMDAGQQGGQTATVQDDSILVRTEDLWRKYQVGAEDILALRGVSIEIRRGQFAAFLGRSGSGKTTLLNLRG